MQQGKLAAMSEAESGGMHDGSLAASAQPESGIVAALSALHARLESLAFPFRFPGAEQGLNAAHKAARQLSDYVIPRYATLDAPLLAVVGGSTGAGKSTLVNSLVGEPVTRASAIRPTTRRPTLVHNPGDAQWFEAERILPHLARVKATQLEELRSGSDLHSSDAGSAITEVTLMPSEGLPAGLALLDSPDIDSVVRENRALAAELLAAADLWIFVTTAARYSDAVPWELLREAAERHVVIAVVLNRVPPEVSREVAQDLAAKLEQRGLADAPFFVVNESVLNDRGFLPDSAVAQLRDWIHGLARDAAARASVARTTLSGAVEALLAANPELLGAYDEQVKGVENLRAVRDMYFAAASTNIQQQAGDGSLLRGELLGRWQDVVGTGEWSRKLESGISRLRDRITGMITGKPPRDVQAAEHAIEDGVYSLVTAELGGAVARVLEAWDRTAGAEQMAQRASEALRSEAERNEAVAKLVRDWQAALLEMVRTEGASKKTTARILSFGVNMIGVALIIVVFANTGGIVGGEVAVAGGTAVVAQKLLEAVFGDDAIRRMTARVKADLQQRVTAEIEIDKAAFEQVLARSGVTPLEREALAVAFSQVRARYREGGE